MDGLAENLRGIQKAADILLERLKEKDYTKYIEMLAFTPKEALALTSMELPTFEALGTKIKALCSSGCITLKMDKDGIVQAKRVE